MQIFNQFLNQSEKIFTFLGFQLKKITHPTKLNDITQKKLSEFKVALSNIDNYTNSFYGIVLASEKSFSENTNELQNLLENNTQFFKKHYIQDIYNYWGSIYFDPENHELLEKFIIQTHPKPETIIKNITIRPMESDFSLLEYFEKQLLKNRNFIISEKLGAECLNISIKKANLNNINYWLKKGIPWQESKENYSELMSGSHKKEDIITILNMIYHQYDLYYGEHILFRATLHYYNKSHRNNMDCLKTLLMLYSEKKLIELDLIVVDVFPALKRRGFLFYKVVSFII